MDLKLKEKICIITGAAGGIGREIALVLNSEGAIIIGIDLKKETGIEQYDEIYSQTRGRNTFIVCNASEEKQIKEAIAFVSSEYKRVDVLVNNMGTMKAKPIEETTKEDWDSVMDINLRSYFLWSREIAGMMKTQNRGKIINMASIAGQIGSVLSGAAYAPSKAGVIGLTKSFAKMLAPFYIQVNAIAPGNIDTALFNAFSESQKKTLIESIPLGRVGKPEEVACAVAFLASEKADYITGQVLNVNGGLYSA